ncbi:MAG: Zn-dependent hydrolase [Firmicutes bacterium]|nr:Zn-dependent hydrolase [Bacillota bacterium]
MPRVNSARIQEALDRFARIGATPDGGVERLCFSEEDWAGREELRRWWEQMGLVVRTDPAANMFARREGTEARPVILLGSHLDTVPRGGRFDGALGVIVATEVVRCLIEAGITTRHPLELVNFTAEEPNAFGRSTIGSRAVAGRLALPELAARNPGGQTIAEGLRRVGGDPDRIEQARRPEGTIAAFLELHIEQGRRLEAAGVPVGVVTHIAGIRRLSCRLSGEANHSGTTRMADRKDALAGAAELTLAVEELARSAGDPAVGTVGRIEVIPNAPNIVPGQVSLAVEFRHADPAALDRLAEAFEGRVKEVAARRGLEGLVETVTAFRPVPMNTVIVETLARACDALEVPYLRLHSMAGHDAGHIAAIAPTGMLFVASRDGKSHTPEEWSDPKAIEQAAQVMLAAVMELDAALP